MYQSHSRRRHGMTIIELLVAMGIASLLAGVIIEVMIQTMRTTEQTSVQTGTQESARQAIVGMEADLRNGYAILPSYTTGGTTYTTQVVWNEQTVVAAVPCTVRDAHGDPFPQVWNGVDILFDCIIWQSTWASGGWTMRKTVVPDAFEMPSSVWAGYTKPTSGYRTPGTTRLFTGAAGFLIMLLGPDNSTQIVPFGGSAPTVTTTVQVPLLTGTTTPIQVTNVGNIRVGIYYAAAAAKLDMGKGSVIQSDTEWMNIRLRNKPKW